MAVKHEITGLKVYREENLRIRRSSGLWVVSSVAILFFATLAIAWVVKHSQDTFAFLLAAWSELMFLLSFHYLVWPTAIVASSSGIACVWVAITGCRTAEAQVKSSVIKPAKGYKNAFYCLLALWVIECIALYFVLPDFQTMDAVEIALIVVCLFPLIILVLAFITMMLAVLVSRC